MPTVDLGTTNTFLGIMAVVSVLEALLVIGIGVGAFMAYRRVTAVVDGSRGPSDRADPREGRRDSRRRSCGDGERQPSDRTGSSRDHRHDGPGRRHRRSREGYREATRCSQAVGVARGISAVIMTLFGGDTRHEPPAPAAGRV